MKKNRCIPITCFSNSSNAVILHNHCTEILYTHYFLLKKIFKAIQSAFNLDYFSLTIINPDNQLVTFSTHPNIEFNLIHSGCWRFDTTFSSKNNPNNRILWWQESIKCQPKVEELKYIKLVNNHFAWGATLSYSMGDCCLLYGFASTDFNNDIIHPDLLRDIGNYMYHTLFQNLINENYYQLPLLDIMPPKLYKTRTNQFLRLLYPSRH